MITVHCMVRNEERFIRHSLSSILPLADRVIVFDTGSTDRTVEVVRGMRSRKIELYQKPTDSQKKLVDYRNEMVRMTRTEWFMVVDGDEVYDRGMAGRIRKCLKGMRGICRVQVQMLDFVKGPNVVANMRHMGKIFRTGKIRFSGSYPFEYPVVRAGRKLEDCSATLPDDIVCYHFSSLERSSLDRDVRARHWRDIPFPLHLYFGPLPGDLGRILQQRSRPGIPLLLAYLKLTCIGFFQRCISRGK